MLAFLRYMRTHAPVALFPVEWSAIRKKALKDGLIEEDGVESGQRFPCTMFTLSAKGREAADG